MRSPAFFSSHLLLLLASCLDVQAKQELTNPDNEPSYQDRLTGSTVEKSRVLSGVGPNAASNRFFDWDESCIDTGQRERIVLAWNAFQGLTTTTSARLTALLDRLPEQPVGTSGDANEVNEAFIKVEDPAYTQMFKARDTGVQYVRDSYNAITNNVQNFQGRARPGVSAALRFICNADDHVQDGYGNPACGSGDTAADALTFVPQRPWDTGLEQKYRFSTASSITFCPRFFDDTKLPNIYSVWTNDQIQPSLNDVDCRERVMLHEYLHLPWVKNMNPGNEAHGYLQAAEYAAGFVGWGSLRSMPECYAWYAIYSAYNNKDSGCERDVWPEGVDKPVKT